MQHLTIYQVIHTLDGKIYHLEEHLSLLFEGYYEVFGRGVKLVKSSIEKQIQELLTRSRCPRGISLFVRLVLSSEGVLNILEQERSLYKGYTLRCIRPRVATVECTIPYGDYPTSMRDEVIKLANFAASKNGGDVALRTTTGTGIIDSINGAQIFGVNTKGIITSAVSHSVEHKFAKEIARQLDIVITERELNINDLPSLDELFIVDHYGVTSMISCNAYHYMSNVANAIALQLSKATR